LLSKTNQKLTLEDVGKLFKVTRMRICQIEKTAIKKLKEKIRTSF
jgi:DNA-directed RNA polymerase sigma subunit (sigma70/sigma32)